MGKSESPSEDRNGTESSCESTDTEESRKRLMSQSERWLRHEHVRNAPVSSKIMFLRGKRLREGEILALLERDTELNDDVDSPESETALGDGDKQKQADAAYDDIGMPRSGAGTPTTSHEEKPIVLYPESSSLCRRKPSTPIKTSPLRFLINSGPYAASATAMMIGIIYATSKYILHPRVVQLMNVRQALAAVTCAQLKELNLRLEYFRDGNKEGITTARGMDIKDLNGVVRIAKTMISETELAMKEAQTQSDIFHQHGEHHQKTPVLDIPESAIPRANHDLTQLSLLTAHLRDLLPAQRGGAMEHTGISVLREDMLNLQQLIQKLQHNSHTSNQARGRFPVLKTAWAKARAAEEREKAAAIHGREDMDMAVAEAALNEAISAVKQEIAGVKGMLLPQLRRGQILHNHP